MALSARRFLPVRWSIGDSNETSRVHHDPLRGGSMSLAARAQQSDRPGKPKDQNSNNVGSFTDGDIGPAR